MRRLDFKTNRVELLTLDELEQTYHENYQDGTPVYGIYHYVLVGRVMEILERCGLKPEVREIFAANNREKIPGVTKLPLVEEKLGENALGAYILRRVYTTINLTCHDSGQESMAVAVAYSQKGVQIGVGPHVHICHNQTILGAECYFSTTRQMGVALPEGHLQRDVNLLLEKFAEFMEQRQQDIMQRADDYNRFADYETDRDSRDLYIAGLLRRRIAADSGSGGLRTQVGYPLSQEMINSCAEDMYLQELEGRPMTLKSLLNIFNTRHKPQYCEVPNIIPMAVELYDYTRDFINVHYGSQE